MAITRALPRDREALASECVLSVCHNMGYFPSLLPDASKKRPFLPSLPVRWQHNDLPVSPLRGGGAGRCSQCRLGNDPLPSSFFVPLRRFTPAKYRKPILRHHDRERSGPSVVVVGWERGAISADGKTDVARHASVFVPPHPPRLRVTGCWWGCGG